MTSRQSRPLARRALAAAAVGLLALILTGCGASAATPPGANAAPAATAASTACPKSQPAPLAAGETRTVVIKTSKGDITLKIEGSLSPIAAGNFVALAACGYYDGVVFHRVVPGFVIQGGDPTGTGGGGPGYAIQDEPVTATYRRGTLAMARSSQPNSQGSQFFIVLADDAAQALASYNTYAIFGEVTAGMEAVDSVAAAADQELPTNPIVMDSVTVTNP
ncbi:MAG: peptidylprolyl isomerase [Candidatus Limnocylindrales bacterium]